MNRKQIVVVIGLLGLLLPNSVQSLGRRGSRGGKRSAAEFRVAFLNGLWRLSYDSFKDGKKIKLKPEIKRWRFKGKEKVYDGQTLLDRAVYSNRLDIVKMLLASGLKVNSQNPIDGTTALHYAIIKKFEPIVQYLVKDAKADISIKNAKKLSSISLAVKYLSAASVGIFIQHNANVNETDEGYRYSVLHRAVHRLRADAATAAERKHALEIIKLLVNKGAKINARDNFGQTALKAIELFTEAAETPEGKEAVTFLKSKGAKP